jgi:CPA2 family monovalent cation:H+ antiporter-2
VIIAGFGLNGQNLARVLRATHIAHIVLDMAPESIARCNAEGSPALIGDATQDEILRHAGDRARACSCSRFRDPFATGTPRAWHASSRPTCSSWRARVRARDRPALRGRREPRHPEEFETSIEIFTAVLRGYHVPNNVIEAQIVVLRQERYSILRGRKLPKAVIEQLDVVLTQGTTEAVVLLHHSPPSGGRSARRVCSHPSRESSWSR